MRIEGFQPSKKPTAMVGAALALGLTAYGIVAKRRASAPGIARKRSPARSSTKGSWRRFVLRLWRDTSQKNLTFIAAGAAFNAFLAIPATLAILASLSLLIFDPLDVQRTVRPVAHLVPPYVIRLLSSPHSRQTLGIGLLFSVTVDLWSVLSGGSCMLTALGLVYGEKSKRGFINHQIAVLVLAAITAPFVLLSLLFILVLPSVLDLAPLSPLAKTAISVGRWPILMGLFVAVRAAGQRYAPHRMQQGRRWMSLGGVVAMLLWTAGSIAFSVFVTEFVPYDQTYGALGSIMGLLAWLNFTALAFLLGAQIDSALEREHQISSDESWERVEN
ncbi:MAG TPA: YihY/virulence factor BrkB family protein [Stellaceae bacterium]|nr:YihY/virulence factor BrkB family protein [Stellaceae bacterium]